MNRFDTYEAEVKEKWGDTDAYREYEERVEKEKRQDLVKSPDDLMAQFASCMKNGETPCSTAAQSLVKTLQEHITKHYYRCTNEILAGLGEMYVADERFLHNIDKHAEGTAVFIREAIRIYCGK